MSGSKSDPLVSPVLVNRYDITLDLQVALRKPARIPPRAQFEGWVRAALEGGGHPSGEVELTIRIVEPQESARLNQEYRHKSGPTNVLSFPFESPPGLSLPLLGDLVICASLVEQQAADQQKPLEAHWAHLVIHGTLHLLGYDHLEPRQEAQMERLEISILAGLGYDNPY